MRLRLVKRISTANREPILSSASPPVRTATGAVDHVLVRNALSAINSPAAMAAIRGRNYVLPDDIKKILAPVMNHRLIVRPESRLRKVTGEKVVEEIVGEIAVPTIEAS